MGMNSMYWGLTCEREASKYIIHICVGFTVAVRLRKACEGLNPKDGNKIGSHAFVFFTLFRESGGRR